MPEKAAGRKVTRIYVLNAAFLLSLPVTLHKPV
jgi:hypothetical protein